MLKYKIPQIVTLTRFYVGPRLLRCPPLSYGRETGGEEG